MKDSIITGAYDLHIHSAPDLLPRKMDDIDMAQRIINCGMAGYAIKSHFFCTAERATLINKLYPQCHAVGTVCLNNSFGGMNAVGLEMAAKAGTKLVWFPTIDTNVSMTRTFNLPPEKRPYWAGVVQELIDSGKKVTPIDVLDENGKILPEVIDVLDVIAKNNMILATGHLSVAENMALVTAAKERKVERIIITHPAWSVAPHTIEEQLELVAKGAYIEYCVNSVLSGRADFGRLLGMYKAIGCEHSIISTDLGQSKNMYPDEGLLKFCTMLVEAGVPEDDVRKSIVDNPRNLIS